MSVRIDCKEIENRDHLLRSWHAALVEVHGSVETLPDLAGFSIPVFNEKGSPAHFEVRPYGERFVEIEVVRESAHYTARWG